MHNRKHTNARARIVFAIEPGDGHEVGKLPDPENGEERNAGPLDASTRRGPSQHGPHGAGKCADESGQRGNALERRVHRNVGKRGQQRQQRGERIGEEMQVQCAQGQRAHAGHHTLRKREASSGEGAIGGAFHPRVGLAFQGFIERSGAGGDQPDAQQCTEQAALQAGYAGVHRAQIVAAPRGDQHKRHNPHFEEHKTVVQQRCRGPGTGRMNVNRMRERLVPRADRWRQAADGNERLFGYLQ